MIFRIIFLLLTIATIGCTGKKPEKPTEIKIAIPNDPSTIDPRRARDMISVDISSLLFSGLMQNDTHGNLVYDLAKEIKTSQNGLQKYITLSDAFWSDGSPITATDVVYSWCSVLDAKKNCPNAHLLFWIKNGAQIYKEALPMDEFGAIAIDEKNILIHLEKPCPFFEKLLTTSPYRPVQKKYDVVHGYAGTTKEIPCSGIYMLAQWNLTESLQLYPNPYKKSSKTILPIRCIVADNQTAIYLFETEQIDIAGSPLGNIPPQSFTQLEQQKLLQTNPACGTAFLRLNTSKPFLNDEKFRRALYFAINKDGIVQHIFNGYQKTAYSLIPSLLDQKEYASRTMNIPLAKKLLNEFLQKYALSPEQIHLTLMVSSAEITRKTGESIADDLQKNLGIKISLTPTEPRTLFSNLSSKNYDIALASYFGDYDDPYSLFSIFGSKDTGSNNTCWENPSYSLFLEQSLQTPSIEERNTLFAKMDSILFENMPIIPLYHVNFTFAQRELGPHVTVLPTGELIVSG